MIILGINDSHDSGAAIIKDGKIVAAINEERLNRIKLPWGFPTLSIKEVFKVSKINPNDVDAIAVAAKYSKFMPRSYPTDEATLLMGSERKLVSKVSPYLGFILKTGLWTKIQRFILASQTKERREKLRELLKKEYGFKCPIYFVDHHLSHAASAYYTCGKDNSLIITLDAQGDGLSGTVSMGRNGKIEILHEIGSYNSIAKYYAYVTKICGFKPGRHEGKITGLAAYGKPIYLDVFNRFIHYHNGTIINYSGSKHESAVKKILNAIGGFKREDLAASIQEHVEMNVVKFIKYWMRKTNLRNVILAGGLFSNVKINQKIHEIKHLDYIFIHPNMGDGGLGTGAALQLYAEKVGYEKIPSINNVYFGPSYNDKEIEEELKKHKLKYKKSKSIQKEIARLIAKSKIVARFNGKMEYGPRALGNRSILYQATDKSVNDWLNKQLKRTEFMPFAPVTLAEDADECYENIEKAEVAALFMVITFNCKELMQERCPAIVHLDNTARPQLITRKINESYYKILKEYKKLTGLPTIVNTSFNMHEEPIVCTPEDAIRSFKQGHLDYLAIGNYLVKSE